MKKFISNLIFVICILLIAYVVVSYVDALLNGYDSSFSWNFFTQLYNKFYRF